MHTIGIRVLWICLLSPTGTYMRSKSVPVVDVLLSLWMLLIAFLTAKHQHQKGCV